MLHPGNVDKVFPQTGILAVYRFVQKLFFMEKMIMKHRQITLSLFVVLVFFWLSGCSRKPEVPKIGLCLRGNSAFQPLQQTLTESGYQVIKLDAKNDQAKQTRQIEGLLADEVDLLIVEPVQTAAAGLTLEQAKAAGVPVLFINKEPAKEVLDAWENVCYVGFDRTQPGLLQGQLVLQTYNKGDINGDGIVTCIVIGGPANHLDTQLHTETCCKALTEQGIEVVRLDAGNGDWTQAGGKRVCEYALSQYGSDVEVVFCNNDAMALGAWTAIQESGRTVGKDIYLTGIGGEQAALDLVQSGNMSGTVAADLQSLAKQVSSTVPALLSGKPVEKLYYIDYIKIACE